MQTSCGSVPPPSLFDLPSRRKQRIGPKPFLKWAGGKWHLLPILLKCAPSTFERYFEPFLGGGASFFTLCPDRAVLSDSNHELIHCYQTARERPQELIEDLAPATVTTCKDEIDARVKTGA
jgi:site-specific DNA-adenine methylase